MDTIKEESLEDDDQIKQFNTFKEMKHVKDVKASSSVNSRGSNITKEETKEQFSNKIGKMYNVMGKEMTHR